MSLESLQEKTLEFTTMICTLCLESITDRDTLYLVVHYSHDGHKESQRACHRRKHLFHVKCMDSYIATKGDKLVYCPNDRDAIEELIETTLKQVIREHQRHYPSYYEIVQKNPNEVALINDSGLNIRDLHGKTLLYCASQRGLTTLVKQLIKRGADPHIGDQNNFTPIMCASAQGYLDIVRQLVRYDISLINHYDICFRLPIDIACLHGHHNVVEYLLDIGEYQEYIYSRLLRNYYNYQRLDNNNQINQIIVRLRSILRENTDGLCVPTNIMFKPKTYDNRLLHERSLNTKSEDVLGKDPPPIIGTNLLDLVYRSVDKRDKPTYGITSAEITDYQIFNQLST